MSACYGFATDSAPVATGLQRICRRKPAKTGETEDAYPPCFRRFSPAIAGLRRTLTNRGERLENQQTRGISAACGPICGFHTASIPGLEPVETRCMPSHTHVCCSGESGRWVLALRVILHDLYKTSLSGARGTGEPCRFPQWVPRVPARASAAMNVSHVAGHDHIAGRAPGRREASGPQASGERFTVPIPHAQSYAAPDNCLLAVPNAARAERATAAITHTGHRSQSAVTTQKRYGASRGMRQVFSLGEGGPSISEGGP